MSTGRRSRQKGANAELEVAALLTEWWGQLEPGVVFKRSPGSGGWASPEVRGAFKTSGDLVTTATRFPFCVEVKRRESFSWKPLLATKQSPVWAWWAQAIDQAAEAYQVAPEPLDKRSLVHPMLWLRHNGEPWRVMISIAVGIILNTYPTKPLASRWIRWFDSGKARDLTGPHMKSQELEVPVLVPWAALQALDPKVVQLVSGAQR